MAQRIMQKLFRHQDPLAFHTESNTHILQSKTALTVDEAIENQRLKRAPMKADLFSARPAHASKQYADKIRQQAERLMNGQEFALTRLPQRSHKDAKVDRRRAQVQSEDLIFDQFAMYKKAKKKDAKYQTISQPMSCKHQNDDDMVRFNEDSEIDSREREWRDLARERLADQIKYKRLMSESPARGSKESLEKLSPQQSNEKMNVLSSAIKITKLNQLGPPRKEFNQFGLLTVKGKPMYLQRELVQGLGERGHLSALHQATSNPREEPETFSSQGGFQMQPIAQKDRPSIGVGDIRSFSPDPQSRQAENNSVRSARLGSLALVQAAGYSPARTRTRPYEELPAVVPEGGSSKGGTLEASTGVGPAEAAVYRLGNIAQQNSRTRRQSSRTRIDRILSGEQHFVGGTAVKERPERPHVELPSVTKETSRPLDPQVFPEDTLKLGGTTEELPQQENGENSRITDNLRTGEPTRLRQRSSGQVANTRAVSLMVSPEASDQNLVFDGVHTGTSNARHDVLKVIDSEVSMNDPSGSGRFPQRLSNTIDVAENTRRLKAVEKLSQHEQQLRQKHGAGQQLLLQESLSEFARLQYARTELGQSFDERYNREIERAALMRDTGFHESFADNQLKRSQLIQEMTAKKLIAADLAKPIRAHAAHSTLVPSSSHAPTEIRRRAQEELIISSPNSASHSKFRQTGQSMQMSAASLRASERDFLQRFKSKHIANVHQALNWELLNLEEKKARNYKDQSHTMSDMLRRRRPSLYKMMAQFGLNRLTLASTRAFYDNLKQLPTRKVISPITKQHQKVASFDQSTQVMSPQPEEPVLRLLKTKVNLDQPKPTPRRKKVESASISEREEPQSVEIPSLIGEMLTRNNNENDQVPTLKHSQESSFRQGDLKKLQVPVPTKKEIMDKLRPRAKFASVARLAPAPANMADQENTKKKESMELFETTMVDHQQQTQFGMSMKSMNEQFGSFHLQYHQPSLLDCDESPVTKTEGRDLRASRNHLATERPTEQILGCASSRSLQDGPREAKEQSDSKRQLDGYDRRFVTLPDSVDLASDSNTEPSPRVDRQTAKFMGPFVKSPVKYKRNMRTIAQKSFSPQNPFNQSKRQQFPVKLIQSPMMSLVGKKVERPTTLVVAAPVNVDLSGTIPSKAEISGESTFPLIQIPNASHFLSRTEQSLLSLEGDGTASLGVKSGGGKGTLLDKICSPLSKGDDKNNSEKSLLRHQQFSSAIKINNNSKTETSNLEVRRPGVHNHSGSSNALQYVISQDLEVWHKPEASRNKAIRQDNKRKTLPPAERASPDQAYSSCKKLSPRISKVTLTSNQKLPVPQRKLIAKRDDSTGELVVLMKGNDVGGRSTLKMLTTAKGRISATNFVNTDQRDEELEQQFKDNYQRAQQGNRAVQQFKAKPHHMQESINNPRSRLKYYQQQVRIVSQLSGRAPPTINSPVDSQGSSPRADPKKMLKPLPMPVDSLPAPKSRTRSYLKISTGIRLQPPEHSRDRTLYHSRSNTKKNRRLRKQYSKETSEKECSRPRLQVAPKASNPRIFDLSDGRTLRHDATMLLQSLTDTPTSAKNAAKVFPKLYASIDYQRHGQRQMIDDDQLLERDEDHHTSELADMDKAALNYRQMRYPPNSTLDSDEKSFRHRFVSDSATPSPSHQNQKLAATLGGVIDSRGDKSTFYGSKRETAPLYDEAWLDPSMAFRIPPVPLERISIDDDETEKGGTSTRKMPIRRVTDKHIRVHKQTRDDILKIQAGNQSGKIGESTSPPTVLQHSSSYQAHLAWHQAWGKTSPKHVPHANAPAAAHRSRKRFGQAAKRDAALQVQELSSTSLVIQSYHPQQSAEAAPMPTVGSKTSIKEWSKQPPVLAEEADSEAIEHAIQTSSTSFEKDQTQRFTHQTYGYGGDEAVKRNDVPLEFQQQLLDVPERDVTFDDGGEQGRTMIKKSKYTNSLPIDNSSQEGAEVSIIEAERDAESKMEADRVASSQSTSEAKKFEQLTDERESIPQEADDLPSGPQLHKQDTLPILNTLGTMGTTGTVDQQLSTTSLHRLQHMTSHSNLPRGVIGSGIQNQKFMRSSKTLNEDLF